MCRDVTPATVVPATTSYTDVLTCTSTTPSDLAIYFYPNSAAAFVFAPARSSSNAPPSLIVGP